MSAKRWRLLALLMAAALLLPTLAAPRWPLSRPLYRYMLVLDITQSMNTQDYHREGLPPDRLGYAKAAIRRAMRDLPCGSEVGIGLFTTQSVQFLFEPLEICDHFAVIDDTVAHIDWRMAWSANTQVTYGLYAALREIEKRDPNLRLAFFTDGQETPPPTLHPAFNGKPGAIRGLIVGTGDTRPVSVPRYDRENRLIGYWENADIETPPVATATYVEHQPAAPALPREGLYLSWLDEAHLKELAAMTGLAFYRLDDPEDLSRTLRGAPFAEWRKTETDIRAGFGIAAWLLLLAVYGGEFGRGRRLWEKS